MFPWSLLSSAEWWQKQPICLNRYGPVRCGGPDQPKNPLLSRTAPCCTNNAMHCHGRKTKLLDCPSSRVAGGKPAFCSASGRRCCRLPFFSFFLCRNCQGQVQWLLWLSLQWLWMHRKSFVTGNVRSFVCSFVAVAWMDGWNPKKRRETEVTGTSTTPLLGC